MILMLISVYRLFHSGVSTVSLLYYEIYHIPSSCIVVVVHVVKGRHYYGYTVYIVTNLDASITETNSMARYSFLILDCLWHGGNAILHACVLYIAQG
jgi:hypothetical protein